ncbi:glutamate--tRNA ligase [Inquilinus sp. Marseille-Q2685]|uniref:glutamate--tRNA ligase n=1 Tax=Inquilinus sp. Marseille-Q2685 TaxID=2866581 RepID=UPI001CE4387E|nr:glutamate--tRNA ligase [Inquilinus sp. Marseille-Q2685]
MTDVPTSAPIITRFAPSPTGLLHVGNVRTALVCWLAARATGGRFLLRLDDTDTERGSAEFAAAIEQDLRWLGLHWDGFARQSDRTDRYRAAQDRLKAAGRLYPCYETAEELELKRKSLLARGLPPLYDRAALALTDADRARLEAEGHRPHWRFKMADAPIEWDDKVRGRVHFNGRDISDPVLVREDGRALYHIGSVVDDIDMGVTLVVRGEDHVANTAMHIQLAEALGAAPPGYAHLSLIADAEGHGLSKRLGSLSLRSLREQGIEPLAVTSLLAKLGTSDPIEPRHSLDDLVAEFDFAKFSRTIPRFDPTELERLNGRILHETPYAAVRDRLAALGLGAVDEAAWAVLRPNLQRLEDAAGWWRVVTGPVTPVVADAGLLAAAAGLLPPEPWDDATWGAWTAAVRDRTGVKGKPLFLTLRLALTGLDHGPELRGLLPLIGRERALARLAGRVA